MARTGQVRFLALMIPPLKETYRQEVIVMSRINEIQNAILALGPGAYQKFMDAKGSNDNSITYYQFGLDACEKVFEIRALAFQSLCLLLENESFHTIAKNELLCYSVPKDSENNRDIAVHDISVLESILSATARSKNFDHCEILDHCHGVCNQLQITCPRVFLRYCYNRGYRLYRALQLKNEGGRYISWEKLEIIRKQRIIKAFEKANDSDLKSLWKRLIDEEPGTDSGTSWKISSGIDQLFRCLSEVDSNGFLHDLEIYIGMQAPFGENRFGIIDGLLNVLPFDQAIKFLKKREFRFQKRWLILAYDSIPDGSITENVCDELVASLVTETTELYNISVRTAFRLNQKYPSFLMRYMTALNVAGEKAPYLLADFLNGLDIRNQPTVFAIVDYFSDSLDILCTAYTLALQMQTFYDHEGQLLIQLVRGKESFLHDLISVLVYKKCTKNNFPPFDVLWNEDNYITLATLVMETLMSIGQSPHDWSFTVVLDKIGEEMYGYSSDPKISERKRIWLNRYIALNAEDTDKMVFLFSIICNGTADMLQNAVSIFCGHNKSYPTFVKLDIEPTHFAWTGSEVPLLEERIANLEIMKESLSGYEYIEHRERIAELIQCLRRQREEELLKDFLRGQR